MKNLDDYTDELGFIGHKHQIHGFEFGDGWQRLGTWYIIQALTYQSTFRSVSLITQVRKCQRGKEWARHPDAGFWWGQPGTMSRDNFDAMFWAWALIIPRDTTLLKPLTKRLGFFWNTKHIWPKPGDRWKIPDWTHPLDLLGRWIRVKRWHVLWPVLVVLDLESVIDSVLRVVASPDDTSNDLNHQIRLVAKQVIMPTPTIKLARWIYRFRWGGTFETWVKYFSPPEAPPMDVLWKPVWEKWIKWPQ